MLDPTTVARPSVELLLALHGNLHQKSKLIPENKVSLNKIKGMLIGTNKLVTNFQSGVFYEKLHVDTFPCNNAKVLFCACSLSLVK